MGTYSFRLVRFSKEVRNLISRGLSRELEVFQRSGWSRAQAPGSVVSGARANEDCTSIPPYIEAETDFL